MTNVRKRSKIDLPSKRGAFEGTGGGSGGQHKQILMKFLNVRSAQNTGYGYDEPALPTNKVSIEDRKHLQKQDMIQQLQKYNL